MRGAGTPMPPTDPLIYRFYELVMVNGPAWKALIEEEFGDGIMSAIDFDMEIERLPDPKGDRVKITHVRQIPAVQVLRRERQHAGIWIQGRLTAAGRKRARGSNYPLQKEAVKAIHGRMPRACTSFRITSPD